jgi:hypothetical protein
MEFLPSVKRVNRRSHLTLLIKHHDLEYCRYFNLEKRILVEYVFSA